MRLLEALMKAVWGTDEKCRLSSQRAESDRILEQAERSVDRLNLALGERPPVNLDEALYEMTRARAVAENGRRK